MEDSMVHVQTVTGTCHALLLLFSHSPRHFVHLFSSNHGPSCAMNVELHRLIHHPIFLSHDHLPAAKWPTLLDIKF